VLERRHYGETNLLEAAQGQSPEALVAGLARAAAPRRWNWRAFPTRRNPRRCWRLPPLRAAEPAILAANAQDVAAGEARGLSGAMLDRLRLDPKRLAGIADAVAAVATLPDPVGQVIDASERPNGWCSAACACRSG
jgi:glutamate-5-semialdehyde dehydrogenase